MEQNKEKEVTNTTKRHQLSHRVSREHVEQMQTQVGDILNPQIHHTHDFFLTPLQQLHSGEEDEKVIHALIFYQLNSSFMADTEILARLQL